MIVVEDARLGQGGKRRPRALDVQLVARGPVERMRRVGSDLGRNAELGKQGEGPTRGRRRTEIEMESDRAPTAKMHCTSSVEQRRELREAIASPSRCYRGELGSHVFHE